ncbi:MAG: patatin-like phospholipase family protein [Rhodopirellula sp.]|nr:patatin-like phospholipase family protein [Rhodopirellula sp.]
MSKSDEPLRKHYKYTTVTGDKVLRDELNRLTRRRSRAIDDDLLPESAPTRSEDVSESLTGLALSGGGIRSGALGLGILQALYRNGLLPFFDYMSTVSGGGYAGAYLSSAGSRIRRDTDPSSTLSNSHDDTVPYGRLKAFHDGEGLSERMLQFIFGGHYLLRTRRFFNRHLMGLLSIWFLTFTGLSSLAALAAVLFRQLDEPIARHFLVGLGFRTDISRGFFPVMLLLVLWCICWGVSFFRASGNMARAQGRFAAKLIPITVGTFGICVAALLGNGEFSLEWLSDPHGLDIAGVFSSAETFFRMAIYGVIGVGLLPFLNPIALIRSGASPKSTSDRVIFSIASRVLLYGLPFLLVSWFAREDISSWTKHRFVSKEIRDVGLRGEHDTETDHTTSTSADRKAPASDIGHHRKKPEDWNDYVALTRSEIAHWNDWQPAWAPFWTSFRAEADEDRRLRYLPVKQAEKALEAAEADANKKSEAAKTATEEATNALTAALDTGPELPEANGQKTESGGNQPEKKVGEPETPNAAMKTMERLAQIEKAEAETRRSKTAAAAKAAEAARTVAILKLDKAKTDSIAAKEDAEQSKRRVAEFLWERLQTSIRPTDPHAPAAGQIVNLPKVPGNADEPDPPYGDLTFNTVEEVMSRIHIESLALQALHACTDQKTDNYAPDGLHLFVDRLLSLASLGPDSLHGAASQNSLGQFVLRRQRLTHLRNWLADHLSRILETTNLGKECDWSEPDLTAIATLNKTLTSDRKSRQQALAPLVERAALMSGRHKSVAANDGSVTTSVGTLNGIVTEIPPGIQTLSDAERRDLAQLNRSILDAAFPETLRDPSTVFASSVLEFDQARRWTMFWCCLGLFVVAALVININATTLHGFYARELANNWVQADQDTDLPLSEVDATDQCLPYHILSGSVHWTGKRNKAAGDMVRDHFLLSPMYCGCEKTGFVPTSLYNDDELGLGDAIAISGAAVSPIQQGNPLLQTLLWLANLRLGQWLPNPNHGTFLPTKSRKLVARTPVTPMRLLWRLFQTAESRPFLFVTDGGHHENLGIGPLLKRRCRFILAIDGGEDADYAFTDLSRLMRWARVKHNVRLQPVDSLIGTSAPVTASMQAAADANPAPEKAAPRSAIDAWNDLAPEVVHRLSPERLSKRHFVVLRVFYPDVEGPAWLVYAKTSLTGDEPAELIRYAESDKKFPHNPTSNQFYAPDRFEAYRQLGEHIVDSMIGQLPSIIAGKMDEHENRPEAPYLGGLLHRIDRARQIQRLNIGAAPPTPEALRLIELLRGRQAGSDAQDQLSRRLTIHPLFVSELLQAALYSGTPLKPRLMSFLFPELGAESSAARQVFTNLRLPGRANAMRNFTPHEGFVPDRKLVTSMLQLAELLAVIPEDATDTQYGQHLVEYDAVYQLLTTIRNYVQSGPDRQRIDSLPQEAASVTSSQKKKTTRRRKAADTPPAQ